MYHPHKQDSLHNPCMDDENAYGHSEESVVGNNVINLFVVTLTVVPISCPTISIESDERTMKTM